MQDDLEVVPLTAQDKADLSEAHAAVMQFRPEMGRVLNVEGLARGAATLKETEDRVLQSHGFLPGTAVWQWGAEKELTVRAKRAR